jgi:hypothetical protein
MSASEFKNKMNAVVLWQVGLKCGIFKIFGKKHYETKIACMKKLSAAVFNEYLLPFSPDVLSSCLLKKNIYIYLFIYSLLLLEKLTSM